jgi:hypothetical protein
LRALGKAAARLALEEFAKDEKGEESDNGSGFMPWRY